MTDSHHLLAEYAQTGSGAAFRELITRYVGLVYSTARRLSTHQASVPAVEPVRPARRKDFTQSRAA
jgi:DNA-directed RNA polymerase specialized sigma subunit